MEVTKAEKIVQHHFRRTWCWKIIDILMLMDRQGGDSQHYVCMHVLQLVASSKAISVIQILSYAIFFGRVWGIHFASEKFRVVWESKGVASSMSSGYAMRTC